MKTKRYCADTMREALEKVKEEMGEKALVVGSRRTRKGSFLGIGGKEQIEVCVSVDVEPRKRVSAAPPPPPKSRFTSLMLKDDPADALPPVQPQAPPVTLFSSLAARAYAEEFRHEQAQPLEISQSNPNADGIATRLANSVKTISGDEQAKARTVIADPSSVRSDGIAAELGRVRAEMRELKFTLMGLTKPNRPSGLNHEEDAAAQDSGVYDSPYYEAYMQLTFTGLQPELARQAMRGLISAGTTSDNNFDLARVALAGTLPSMVTFADDFMAIPPSTEQRCILSLVGPTGVGKTTTIAKLAARATLREGRRVELITLDTYRIGSIEQLKTYAEIMGAGFHVPGSVLELDALVRRLSEKATVMIDTVGRGPSELGDQMEVADYLRRNDEIFKCVVIQATTNPSDAHDAIDRYTLFGPDAVIFTKLDETCRPGEIVAAAAEANLPIAYLCNGQRVPWDIEKASTDALINNLLPCDMNTKALAA